MEIKNQSPWLEIEKPEIGFNIKRIDPNHPHNCFWGKDSQGYYLFLMQVDPEHLEYLESIKLNLKGVKKDIRREDRSSGGYYFILCLQSTNDADIFYSLCVDLFDSTKDIEREKTALEIIHKRLKRWKNFLSSDKRKLLSAQEIQGLYAELYFLQQNIKQGDNSIVIVNEWHGPLGAPQDFLFGDYAVEIKSISGSHGNKVRISSENQLVTNLDMLYLHVIFLTEYFDCVKGISLNQIVDDIKAEITDEDDLELFLSRLYMTGYIELKDYDKPCYSVCDMKTFRVQEDFPRIVPDDIDMGIANVTYDLSLSSIEDYSCELPSLGGANDPI